MPFLTPRRQFKRKEYLPMLSCLQGHPVVEKYFKPGTTIVLRCLVTNYRSVDGL